MTEPEPEESVWFLKSADERRLQAQNRAAAVVREVAQLQSLINLQSEVDERTAMDARIDLLRGVSIIADAEVDREKFVRRLYYFVCWSCESPKQCSVEVAEQALQLTDEDLFSTEESNFMAEVERYL